jgi:hypothetical protein
MQAAATANIHIPTSLDSLQNSRDIVFSLLSVYNAGDVLYGIIDKNYIEPVHAGRVTRGNYQNTIAHHVCPNRSISVLLGLLGAGSPLRPHQTIALRPSREASSPRPTDIANPWKCAPHRRPKDFQEASNVPFHFPFSVGWLLANNND